MTKQYILKNNIYIKVAIVEWLIFTKESILNKYQMFLYYLYLIMYE
jgi:hypothetical protein